PFQGRGFPCEPLQRCVRNARMRQSGLMPTSLSPRHVIAALIGAALIVAVGALEFATATANKRGVLLLFGTIAVGLALIGIATRLTRRVRVGSRLPMRMGSRAIFAWIFTRLILLVAV